MAHGVVITFLIEYQNTFLLVLRSKDEENFPNTWAFPGGNVHAGETVVDTIRREVKEETALDLYDDIALLDTYAFSDKLGLAFLIRAKNNSVELNNESEKYKWVSSLEELKEYNCIPGIYNHLDRALAVLEENHFSTMTKINLTPDLYLNTN